MTPSAAPQDAPASAPSPLAFAPPMPSPEPVLSSTLAPRTRSAATPLPSLATTGGLSYARGDAEKRLAEEPRPDPAKAVAARPADASVLARKAVPADHSFIAVTEGTISVLPLNVVSSETEVLRRERQERVPPSPEEVQIGPLVNSFSYTFASAKDDLPCAVAMEVASCPWEPSHRLVRVALKARDGAAAQPGVALDELSTEVRFNPRQVAAFRLLGDQPPVLADSRR